MGSIHPMEIVAYIRHLLCGDPESLAAVLVFCCLLTTNHKHSSLEHPLYSCRSDIQAAASLWVTEASVELWAGQGSHWEPLGENQLPSSFRLPAESSSKSFLRLGVSVFLLAVIQGSSQVLDPAITTVFPVTWLLPPSKAPHPILLLIQVSLLSSSVFKDLADYLGPAQTIHGHLHIVRSVD